MGRSTLTVNNGALALRALRCRADLVLRAAVSTSLAFLGNTGIAPSAMKWLLSRRRHAGASGVRFSPARSRSRVGDIEVVGGRKNF